MLDVPIRGLSVIVPRLTPPRPLRESQNGLTKRTSKGRALRAQICHRFAPLATALTRSKAVPQSLAELTRSKRPLFNRKGG
jgi:hypothetical protein